MQHAHQIDVEHPTPIVERDVVDAAGGRDAGIVADHMDVAERLDRLLGRAIDTGGIGDVAEHAAHLRPDIVQALDGVRERLALDIGQHHLHAGLRKGAAERKTDAAGAAGYECRLAGELAHDGLLTA